MTLEHPRYFGLCPCCAPVLDLSHPSRRRFVAGAVVLSAFAATGSTFASKAQAQPRLRRIDAHHHISPPTWLNAIKKASLDNPPMANWSVQKTFDDMDKGGVATAITSPTTPQVTPLVVTDDKIYCIYIARDEGAVGRHARSGAFPANKVARVRRMIDPTTAEV